MDTQGTYLQLMRARFNQNNSPHIDFVPWELDDKDTAYKYVEGVGHLVPKRERTTTPAQALSIGETLGDRFVVKQPNRHSTMGVYVLEKLGNERYLDLFSLNELDASDVKAVGPEPDYWLTEECLASPVAGRALPFDYKIYTFRGRVSHVVQIDRNVYPPRVAVFDGAFIPLQPGVDYTTNPDRWLLEHHVMPKYAGAMLKMASELSGTLDTRFVRIDCYDGPDGPVFGEFTFASGPDDVGMLRYSSRVLKALDEAMAGGEIGALSGFNVDMPEFRSSLTGGETIHMEHSLLRRISAGAPQGDTRYASTIVKSIPSDSAGVIFSIAANLIGYLNGDGSRAFSIQHLLRRGTPLIKGLERLREFDAAALRFHESRANGNPWHSSRAAEVRLAMGDLSALDTLRKLADSGYEHAKRVLAANEIRE
ncbi:ATP-grasp fold amidoligase family protein [Georgenia sp. AZ-5]|uniref:ATP-grasp fold amidoligase family protein n=1 Tax=Georgenia sp. AZ-5 TaxID=3367526 RepID=UPI0037549045